MRGSQKLCRAFGSLLLVGGVLLANVVAHRADAQKLPRDAHTLQTLIPAPPKRLLVVVPHPDDASLGGTAMIDRTLRSGGAVKLAVMTSGDGFRLAASRMFGMAHPGAQDLYQLGLVRQQEELASARQLGLGPEAVQFLGYPDTGMHQLWSSSHWTARSAYHALNGYDHVPYSLAYNKGAPYCGQAVVDDVSRLIADFMPTDVLYPDPHDIHNDHWATSAFTQYVLAGMRHPPRSWTYIIHYPNFPVPRYYRPQRALLPPPDLKAIGGVDWLQLTLPDSLIDSKKRAILSHKTQMNVMGDLLLSFARTNDLIGQYTPPLIQELHGETNEPFAEEDSVLSFCVVRDPAWDEAKEPYISSADILQVAMERSGGRLHVCVEYKGDVRPDLDYWVRLRMPDLPAAMPRRLEYHIQGGKLRNNPLRLTKLPTVTIRERRLILSLPEAPFYQAGTIIMSTDVSQNQHFIDKTAWQTLRVQTLPLP